MAEKKTIPREKGKQYKKVRDEIFSHADFFHQNYSHKLVWIENI